MPPAPRQAIEIHLYQPEVGGLLFYRSTMGKYMNHSREPNFDLSEDGIGWETRDIQPDEAFTCDYRHFMADVSCIAYL